MIHQVLALNLVFFFSPFPVLMTASRLLHYFRGHHHLEEIMYNENMRRSQLKTLFDKFRSVLVVTNHEDPIIAIFQSPTE